MTVIEFREGFLHMDVLCVKRHYNYTFAGIGSNLFVYSDQSFLLSKQIFIGERIHQISTKKELILVKGGRQLALLTWRESLEGVECTVVSKIQSNDWIQVAVVFENQLVGLVTAHNVYETWNVRAEKRLDVCSSEEKCILYSCTIVGESREELVVFAGTAFGDVLIWSPQSEESHTLQTLTQAHYGAVFSIEVRIKNKILATTSDDRCLKVWSIISEEPLQHPDIWKNSTIHLLHSLYGHTARVWRSLISEDYYVTGGEDSQLLAWGVDGKYVNCTTLHQESGIRALDYSEGDCIVTTGGEDGGINAFPLERLTGSTSSRVFNLGQSVSTKVRFVPTNGFVYTLNGSCFLVSSEDTQEILYKSDNFSSYCVLEVSTEGAYIAMGSIKGDLVVIDAETKVILTEERIVNGRVYSVHWFGLFLLTCGPKGRLDLWKLSSGVLTHTCTKTLPKSKERWTTCGAVLKEKLILGDRKGNLHVYNLEGGEIPVETFRKIHNYLGVSDVYHHGSDWFSIGRDGTLKEYTEDFLHFVKTRLPMKWLWKIVPHGADTLILGFHSVLFMVWSTHNREIIASHECGGGHRSCDFKIIENTLHFLYVKDTNLHLVEFPLDDITRIRYGFHGKEINCLRFLQTIPEIIITGSEDNTVRITKIDKLHLEPIQILETHVSSVRVICTYPTETGHLVVSAGGKGQFVVWEFDKTTLKSQELVNHRLRRRTYTVPFIELDPETRIMCVDITKVENDYVIAAGCSDFKVRLFRLQNGCLSELLNLFHSHCVLNLTFLYVDSFRVLVSMTTDGTAIFWNLTDFCPLHLETFSLHQSGINSFQFEEIGTGEFILATGGDDNSVCVSFVEISNGEVKLTSVWDTSTAHSCQITGIIIMKGLLITTSIDQRITVWKWSWHDGKFTAEYLNQCLTSVPDVKGMDAVQQNENSITVAVHGKGLEFLRLDIKESG